jgi:hypothetical protein
MKLSHGQIIRVKGFSKYANKITVGTARGYATQYNEDPESGHARTLSYGHDTAWTNQSAGELTSDYPGKKEKLDAEAAAIAAAPEIEDGQTVEIEGESFRVRVNDERYSNPVKFIRQA